MTAGPRTASHRTSTGRRSQSHSPTAAARSATAISAANVANAQAGVRGDIGTDRSVGGYRCARCPDNRPTSGFAFGVVGGRRVRRRPVPLEMRDVAAFRNRDAHGVPSPGIDIVAVEVASQAPRFEPHDRVSLAIEGLVAPEDGERDRIPRQPVGTSCKLLRHQIPQKRSPPRAHVKSRARQDAIQLRLDVGWRWLSTGRKQSHRRVGRSFVASTPQSPCVPSTGTRDRLNIDERPRRKKPSEASRRR